MRGFAHKLVPINPPTRSFRKRAVASDFVQTHSHTPRISATPPSEHRNLCASESCIRVRSVCCGHHQYIAFYVRAHASTPNPTIMKCLRVFGRNVSASATRKIKSNVSRARHQHRSGAAGSSGGRSASRPTKLARGAHNQRRRRPRTTTGARDQQMIALRTDRLWNFGVQSDQPDPHDVPGNGLSYGLRDGSLYRQALMHPYQPDASLYGGGFCEAPAAGGGRQRHGGGGGSVYGMPWGRATMNGARNGLDYVGVPQMMPSALISDDQQQQYAYGSVDHHQYHRQHVSANLKAYKRHHSLV